MKIYNLPPPCISVYMRLIYIYMYIYISFSIYINLTSKSDIYIQFVCMCVFVLHRAKRQSEEERKFDLKLFLVIEMKVFFLFTVPLCELQRVMEIKTVYVLYDLDCKF